MLQVCQFLLQISGLSLRYFEILLKSFSNLQMLCPCWVDFSTFRWEQLFKIFNFFLEESILASLSSCEFILLAVKSVIFSLGIFGFFTSELL